MTEKWIEDYTPEEIMVNALRDVAKMARARTNIDAGNFHIFTRDEIARTAEYALDQAGFPEEAE